MSVIMVVGPIGRSGYILPMLDSFKLCVADMEEDRGSD